MLNESQERHVTATLRVTEEELLALRRHVAGAGPRQTLFAVENDVSADDRMRVTQKIDDALALIEQTKTRLSLGRVTQSLRHLLIATVTLMVVDLADTKADGLRVYGPPDPDVWTTLDPMIDDIVTTLDAIVTLMRGA